MSGEQKYTVNQKITTVSATIAKSNVMIVDSIALENY